ncbi:MAG TPA: WD40 repeat domain-containing protein, partial [Polyangia bacterium]|nr:WD40 repeat domain-containing protein [Polyangia bacterium]
VSTSSWAVVRTLTVTDMVYGLSFTPDGTQIVTLTTDSSTSPPTSHLYVHTATNPAATQTVALTAGWSMGVSPVTVGGALPIAVTTTTGSVLVYNLTAAGLDSPSSIPVTSNQMTVQMAQFSPSGALLAAGGDDGYLRFWAIPLTGAAQAVTISIYGATNAKSAYVDAVAFSPDGGELALGGGTEGSVTTFATGARTQIGVEQDTSSGADVTALGYSPDGKWIIGGEYACGCVFLCRH